MSNPTKKFKIGEAWYPAMDEAARESIAPVFSTTTAYAVGDYIYYDDKLYRFTAAHSAGTWNTSQVTEVTVGNAKADKANEIMFFPSQTVNARTNQELFRITNSEITQKTVVLSCVWANPSYITSDVRWTSYDAGYVAFVGTCSTATTADVTLGISGN